MKCKFLMNVNTFGLQPKWLVEKVNFVQCKWSHTSWWCFCHERNNQVCMRNQSIVCNLRERGNDEANSSGVAFGSFTLLRRRTSQSISTYVLSLQLSNILLFFSFSFYSFCLPFHDFSLFNFDIHKCWCVCVISKVSHLILNRILWSGERVSSSNIFGYFR